MYLISQMVWYLMAAFLAGIGAGYGLWKVLGERENVAKFNAAEMELANYLARREDELKQREVLLTTNAGH